MNRLKKLLSAGTLAMTIAGAALAGPAQGADGVIPYDSYSSAGPTLLPDGVGVFERRGLRVTFNAIDATGARTTLARARLDRRVNLDVESDDSDANAATSATHSVVSFAAEAQPRRGRNEIPLGGTVQAGPIGGAQMTLHSCAGESQPAPIAIDGSLVAAAERTTCGRRDEPRFDVVARDLSGGATATTLARDVIVGNDLIAVAGPYVAFAATPTEHFEGYGDEPIDLRVYDVRSGAQVTRIRVGRRGAIASLDVLSDGRVVACNGTRAAYADPGERALHRTGARCRRIQGLPNGRVAVEHERQIDVVDLATGQPTVLLRMGTTRLVPFETDGTRIAWQDVSCRSVLARVARLDQLGPAAASVPELRCPIRVSHYIDVNARRHQASVTVTCPKGCAGPAYLVSPTSAWFISSVEIDPVPGRPTRVTFPLDRLGPKVLARWPRAYVAVQTLATSPRPDYTKRRVRFTSR